MKKISALVVIAGLFLSVSSAVVLAEGECPLSAAKEAKAPEAGAEKEDVIKFQGYTVVSVDEAANKLVIKTKKGGEKEIALTSNTKFKKGKKAIGCSALTAGERVSVHCMEEDGKFVASKVKVWKKRAASLRMPGCTVVSLDAAAGKIVVKDTEGAEKELVLDDKVKYSKGKESIALSDISAGNRVTVFFKKDKEGNDVVSTVRVLKDKPKSEKKAKRKGKKGKKQGKK